MGRSIEQDLDIEEIALKVEDVYGEEAANKFTELADLNPDDGFKYLGKLFCDFIPEDDEDEDDFGDIDNE